MKKIAVAILNYNGEALLKQFLPSVVKYSPQATIYVIDNNSTDNSLEVLQQEFPEVKIIQNQDNYGYAGGYNIGLKQIEEPYLALVNSDIEVTPNWLDPILELWENSPNTAIIQPKILDYKNPEYFEYAGAGGGFIDKYGFPFTRGRIFDTIEKDMGQYNDIADIFWASGACFFIRTSVFWELKGFDTDFFAHQEEIDLCWRAHHLGYKTQYCGLSTVYHLGGATLGYQNPQKTYLNFRNSLLMMYKNLPKNSKFCTIFSRLSLDGIAGIRLLTQGKPKHCWAIIRSHFAFYKRIPNFNNKVVQEPISNYHHCNSIVYRYFVQGKKYYNNI
ncbi:glycosyltransferase family 2 protein [Myroides sp. LJL116]